MASEMLELMEEDENPGIPLRNMTQGNALLEIASSGELFHDERKEVWIRIREGEKLRTFALQGEGFRNWIMSRYQALSEKTIHPAAVERAVRVLAARAIYHSPKYVLYNRGALRAAGGNEPAPGGAKDISHPPGKVAVMPEARLPELWLDLADGSGRAVRVRPEGWELAPEPPPLFRQYAHQQPLPAPEPGDIQELFQFLPEMPESRQEILLAWLTMAIYPFRSCPLLCLYGAQGAAKTTMARMLRELIDPSLTDNFDFHLQFAHLPEILYHHALPVFDNVGVLNKSQVNLLCRAVTGGSWSKRKLFSDSEDVVFRFRRPILLTALEIPSLAPDWLERCLLMPLDSLTGESRREEHELWAAFHAARPRLLGGLLDLVSRAMRQWPEARQTQLPRMADFARWGTAVMMARGKAKEDFAGIMAENQTLQSQEVAGSDSFATAVIYYIQSIGYFKDSPARLLYALNQKYKKIKIANKSWPLNEVWLSRRLAELKSVLQDHFIEYRTMRNEAKRIVELSYTRRDDAPPEIIEDPILAEDESEEAKQDRAVAELESSIKKLMKVIP